MTSYDTLAVSTASSRPIEVYEIALGSTTWFYTSADEDVTVGGNVYLSSPIRREKLTQSTSESRRNLVVNLPASYPFPQLYVNNVPGERATLTVYRFERDESPAFDTQVLLFTGFVQSVQFPGDASEAKIAVQSLESALAQNVPRVTYMGQCNNLLYDQFCGVDPNNFNHIGAVTAVDANVITVTGAGSSGFDFTGGYARPTGENDFRLVVAQDGDDLTLLLPFSVDVDGSNVQVFAGCDKELEGDCALVFDNVINFMGFFFGPNRNPFLTGID